MLKLWARVVSLAWICTLIGTASLLAAQSANPAKPNQGIPDAQIPEACKTLTPSGTSLSLPLSADAGPRLYEQLGTAFGRAGNPKCAIIAFRAALALDPGATQGRYSLGLALIEDHQPEQAAGELRTVIREQPDSFAAHNALGLALQDAGDQRTAANEFRTALRINPSFSLAYYDLARLLSSEHNNRAAMYYLKQALATSPPVA